MVRAVSTSSEAVTAALSRLVMARKATARKVMTDSISNVMTSATAWRGRADFSAKCSVSKSWSRGNDDMLAENLDLA